MEPQTHYFFAVSIPEEIKLQMKAHFEKLKDLFPFNRWVHYKDIHVTLAFLGFAPKDNLEKAIKNVKDVLRSTKTFQLQINKLGIFGKPDSPRIFFADTIESQELKKIRNKVFTACEDAGFQLETRAFRPHITLARKWESLHPFQMDSLVIWEKLQPDPLEFDVKNVVLYKTNLHQTPKYEAIVTISLE
ncbi:MAG: RNA 2',3'-cyclic phosphodiesterase [Bacillota bacterium]|nr:RNA 2',3'-cyclic phosphodiesterase [Bacillota bacterium]